MKKYKTVITEEDGGFVARDSHTGVTSQGATKEGATVNLREATALYFQEVGKRDIMITASSSVGLDYLKDENEDIYNIK
jgi:predicted RNase H-like HicB family nuclease